MIGYLEGKILKKEADRILLLAGAVGYEIMVPGIVMDAVADKGEGDAAAFHIYYHQTERQPKPVLIGFLRESEKEFFQLFLSVKDLGPLKMVKALTVPIRDIAAAIEAGDAATLRRLKGIGERTARQIIATLEGKIDPTLFPPPASGADERMETDVSKKVMDVLVTKLGYKSLEARQMVAGALKRNENVSTPEELFDEIFRGGAAR